MRASGVVLRGSPRGATTIVAAGRGRRTLLQLGGGQEPSTGTAIRVIDETVPAGSRTLRVASVEGFRAGGRVVVTRPSTKEWISALGMDTLKGNFSTLRITWTPGSRNLVWDRTIVSVDPARRELSLDAPITTSLEARFGGGTVSPVTGGPPAAHLGVENLNIESEYDASNSKDEEHAWIAQPDEDAVTRAQRVVVYKSAKYSVEAPLVIGARLGGATAAQVESLRRFGIPLGIAYQLRDDLLGVYGDPEVTGKPAGDDLREGKRTVLIAYAREQLPASSRRVIDDLLGDPDLDEEQIGMLQRTIQASGARDRVEGLITSFAAEADRALAGARLGNAAVGELRDLARAATERTS